MDAQAIYQLSLRWKITGDTNYADHAVMIANEWAKTLKGINGDSNAALGCSIPGYLFAVGGEILSTYQNWTIDDRKAYMDMMMQIFYPANMNFLWWHYDTYWRTGGNTHYRSNWDTAAIAALAAIGILCDNKAVYLQALDFFKYGPGNGRIERAAWYIHPNGLAQGEEAGRDQAHNLGAWHAIALLCQMAWNQGDDLFSYDNYRVLRAFEYNAKYNLGYEVPYARHRNCDLKYTEGTISVAQRGLGGYYQWELVYNHYTNIKGISAPWSEKAAIATRPEPRPNPRFHPSQLDWFGLGSLTYSRDPIPKGVRPNNLAYQWSKGQITLNWIGTAYATGYNIKRATTHGGPYSIIEKTEKENTFYTDTNVVNGTTYYYVISANTPSGETENSPELKVKQELKHHFPFEENLSDIINGQNGRAHGGNTGLPSYAIGFPEGKSIYLDGIDDYIQLPSGIANYQDITIATWVNWSGGNAWQRIFDFGSEIEKTLFLTPANREGKIQLGFTTTRGGNVVGDASYYLIGPEMPINKWTHLAFTINGDIMTLYVNGIPVDYKTNDLIDPLFSQIFCYLGRSMYNNDPYFHGYIDDFRIYNYPLSPKEISDLVVQGYKTNAGENK